jgi:hypothetical protein
VAFNVREIFKALADAGVDYVVVGGLAVILHGYLRATAVLDIVLGLAHGNARRGMQALASIGMQPRLPLGLEDFADAGKRREWRDQRNMQVFPLWDPTNPLRSVDVFVEEPIPFDQLAAEAVTRELDGVPVRVASIAHLIRMKRASGRPRDLDDIDKLQQIRHTDPGQAP